MKKVVRDTIAGPAADGRPDAAATSAPPTEHPVVGVRPEPRDGGRRGRRRRAARSRRRGATSLAQSC